MASMAVSAPITLILRAVAPVATMTSSAESEATDLISVFSLIVIGYFCSSRMYHAMSSRSFSLKDGAAAAINTPPSVLLLSYNVTL